jgi:hypothetical protein
MPEEGFPGCSGVVTNTNLFWRDKQLNRKDDNLAFKLIQEARALNESKEEAAKWRATWIALLISTKHEGKGSVCRGAARSGSNGPVDRSFPLLELDVVWQQR